MAVKSGPKIAVDAIPLLGNRTGVGSFAGHLFEQLSVRDDLRVTGYLFSYNGGAELLARLPTGVAAMHKRFPARFMYGVWDRLGWPKLSGFDLIHGVNYVLPPSAGAVELITIHDLAPWRFPELLAPKAQNFPRLAERAIERGAHVHAVTNHVASEVVEYLGVDESRVTPIHLGTNWLDKGSSDRGKARAGGDFVLAIGTVEPRKDYPTLIEAMNFVWDSHPDLKLVVAGGAGWGIEQFEAAVENCAYPANVVHLGFVDAKTRADLLAGCKMLAYPSIDEGFGLPVLEAMSVGVPVVSTQIGAVIEVAGNAAQLVPPQSATALAGAILDMIEDDAARKHFSVAGPRHAAQYSWEQTAEQIVELYFRLLSK